VALEVAGRRLVKSLAVNFADDPHFLGGSVIPAIAVLVPMNGLGPFQEVPGRLMVIMAGTLWTPGSTAVLVVRDRELAMLFTTCRDPGFVVLQRVRIVPIAITVNLAQFVDLLFDRARLAPTAPLASFTCDVVVGPLSESAMCSADDYNWRRGVEVFGLRIVKAVAVDSMRSPNEIVCVRPL
jgi:hypothetical protein